MARFLYHAPCERCGSRDNLGVYDDGSTFCFGCRWSTRPNLSSRHAFRSLSKSETSSDSSGTYGEYSNNQYRSGNPLRILKSFYDFSDEVLEKISEASVKCAKPLTQHYPDFVLEETSKYVSVEELIKYEYYFSPSRLRLYELVKIKEVLCFLSGKLYYPHRSSELVQLDSEQTRRLYNRGIWGETKSTRNQSYSDWVAYGGRRWNAQMDTSSNDDTLGRENTLAQQFFKLGGRNFPKYLSAGSKEALVETKIGAEYEERGVVVLTEDSFSGIVVSRVGVCAWPLYGTHLQSTRATALTKKFHTCYVWLDRDKFRESVELADKLKMMGLKAKSIFSELDPKCYNLDQVKRYLNAN